MRVPVPSTNSGVLLDVMAVDGCLAFARQFATLEGRSASESMT
jgi:hypothetical protein